jgi:hypothetical protein
MSHTEGLSASETALRYVEDTTPADLLLLRCLRNIAAKKRGTAIKNKTVKDFFMKVYDKQFIIIIIYERQTALLYYPRWPQSTLPRIIGIVLYI